MKKAAKKRSPATSFDFSSLWLDLSLEDWRDVVHELAPQARCSLSGPHIKGHCPFHDDAGPSFHITPSRCMAKCFGCGKAFFDPLRLVGALAKDSADKALLFLKKKFGRKISAPEALC